MKNQPSWVELEALKYLVSLGYNINQIGRGGEGEPDFLCNDGKRYEVKKGRSPSFTLAQIRGFRDDDIILFRMDGEFTQVKWGDVKDTEKILPIPSYGMSRYVNALNKQLEEEEQK